MNTALSASLEIREVIENWSMFRDAADWDRFPSVWHSDGIYVSMWFQGHWRELAERTQATWYDGMSSVHFLCGSQIDSNDDRAVARTNLKTFGRGTLDGVEYDLEATAQFVDLLECRESRWALCERWVVYVKDRIDAVAPTTRLVLDETLLNSFPAHYRHLAYIHARAGREVKRDMPGVDGIAADRLRQRERSWHLGEAIGAPC